MVKKTLSIKIKLWRTGIRVVAVVLPAVFVSSLVGPAALAMSTAQQQIFDYGIGYFNVSPEATCSGETISLVGSSNVQKAFNFFIQKGLTPVQSAGLVGNLDAESSLYPGRQQGQPITVVSTTPIPGSGYGIAQWTTQSRQQALVAFAQKQGTPIDDLGMQLAFVWQELTTNYSSALTELKSQTTVQGASDIILQTYEVALDHAPGGTNSVIRGTLSAQILKQYGGSVAEAGGGSSGGSTCGSTTSGAGSCQNPVRDIKGLRPERIDQGVDYNGSGSVYAMCPGTVVAVDGPGWPGNEFITIHVAGSNSPADGKYIYFAEDCTPQVKVGQTVTTTTVICNMYDGPDGVETGWAAGPSSGDVALAHSEYAHDGLATSYGQNFSAFLKSVGAPPGVLSLSSGVSNKPLPSGWPTW